VTAPEDPKAKAQAIEDRLRQLTDPTPAAVQRAQEGESSWTALADGIGRNARPELLWQVWEFLPTDQRIVAIGDAWVHAEYPEWHLDGDVWLRMFRDVGYHDEDRPAQPPDSITLWRGGTIAGMS